jgi:hypothetical protein
MWWAALLNTILGAFSSGVAASTSSYESIATVTAAGGEASLSFTSIPSTYASLQIRGIAKDTNTASDQTLSMDVRFNSDTGANYAYHYLEGNGTSATASGANSQTKITINGSTLRETSASSTFAVSLLDIHNYASTTQNKTLRYFSGMDKNTGTTASKTTIGSGVWLNTSAITTVTLIAPITAFKAGSTFALYGIKG